MTAPRRGVCSVCGALVPAESLTWRTRLCESCRVQLRLFVVKASRASSGRGAS